MRICRDKGVSNTGKMSQRIALPRTMEAESGSGRWIFGTTFVRINVVRIVELQKEVSVK
jgi:hypothetical protein